MILQQSQPQGVVSHLDLLLTIVGFMAIHTVIFIWYVSRRDLQHRMMWHDYQIRHKINGDKKSAGELE